MNVPAFILCDPATASFDVAGLSVLDRLMIGLVRAGCGSITLVAKDPLPPLKRAQALGVSFRVVPEKPARLEQATLVMTTDLLVHASDVRNVLQEQGRLVNARGEPLPIGVLTSGWEDLDQALRERPVVNAAQVAESIRDQASARRAAGRLWRSLRSSADGVVDRFLNRPLGRFLSLVLVHTPVTPNQVSVVATLVGLVSAWLFSRGGTDQVLWGAILLQLSAVIDCVDGDLARVKFLESPLGRWLDIVGDQVVHIGVFVAIGVGLWRTGASRQVMVLGASAGVGVVVSFAVVLRGLLHPRRWKGTAYQKLMDATTNRDFSLLLLFLVIIHRLEVFLWIAAIGIHVFWIIALILQTRSPGPAADLRPSRETRV